jgi:flagellar motor switch protein FliN/FliY
MAVEARPENNPPDEGQSPEAPAPEPEVVARVPQFTELNPGQSSAAPGSLDRLLDVTVTVAAELGRVTLPISEILKLGPGSVVELDRAVTDPVDLMVQGVRLARGEVVVVGDRFAVRIKEIAEPRKRL